MMTTTSQLRSLSRRSRSSAALLAAALLVACGTGEGRPPGAGDRLSEEDTECGSTGSAGGEEESGSTGGDEGGEEESGSTGEEPGTTGEESKDQTDAYLPVLPNGRSVLLMDQAPLRVLDANPGNISAVVAGAKPGDRIELAAGDYSGFDIAVSGTEEAPIVIAAADPHAAVLKGIVDITGSWLRIDQLEAVGAGRLDARDGASHIRIDRCRFVHNTNVGIRLRAAVRDVRVSRNEAIEGKAWWIYYDIDGLDDSDGPKDMHLDHNYLHGYRESPSIRLGDTSHALRAYELRAVVEYNRLEDSDGHRELVVLKSSRNWVRWNTITGLYRGDIAVRQGSYHEIYGNVMIGAGGITLTATDNLVYNNTIIDGNKGIWLMAGDNTWDETTDQRPIYDRTENCVVANNTVVATNRTAQGIAVGRSFSQDGNPVVDCDVANNLVVLQSGAPGIELFAPQEDNRFHTNWVTAAQGYTGDGVEVGDLEFVEDGPLLRPVEGSPLQGAGTPIEDFGVLSTTIEDDRDGQLRGPGWDIGADQIGGDFEARGLMTHDEVGPDAADPYAE